MTVVLVVFVFLLLVEAAVARWRDQQIYKRIDKLDKERNL